MLLLSALLVFLPLLSICSGQNCGSRTRRDVSGPFFVENGLTTYDIAPQNELNKPNQMVLEGTVSTATNGRCLALAGATVEVWYAGGENPHYTFPSSKLWYRGKTLTDQDGQYSFRGTLPGVYIGRPIRHVHYKVTDNVKGVELVTQLYFRNYVPPSYEDYVKGRETQFPNEFTKMKIGSKVVFNVVM